jgi:hypothetical protein
LVVKVNDDKMHLIDNKVGKVTLQRPLKKHMAFMGYTDTTKRNNQTSTFRPLHPQLKGDGFF